MRINVKTIAINGGKSIAPRFMTKKSDIGLKGTERPKNKIIEYVIGARTPKDNTKS